MAEDTEPLINRLPEDLDGSLRRIAEEIILELSAKQVNTVAALLSFVQDRSQDARIRARACWLLGRVAPRKAGAAAIRLFSESIESALVWEAAKVAAIGGSKSAAAEQFINALDHGPTTAHRLAGAWALGLVGDSAAVAPLQRVLDDPGADVEVRAHAAEALGGLDAKSAIPALMRALDDPAPSVRYWTAYALGSLGDPVAIPLLERVAASDTTVAHAGETVADEARSALERIRNTPADLGD